METPPQKEFQAARKRLSQGAAAIHPGTITFVKEGVDYRCAVSLRAESFTLGERGLQRIQQVDVVLSKDQRSEAPFQGQIVKVNGLAFKVGEVLGANAVDTDWYFNAERTPGGDG